MSLKERENIAQMVEGLAKRWSKRLNISETALSEVLTGATREVYQEKPFTTAIVKKVVNGKQIRGVGFLKYNMNDSKLGPRYAWDEAKGKLLALNRAYHSFIMMLVKEKVFSPVATKRKVKVSAVVKNEQIEVVQ